MTANQGIAVGTRVQVYGKLGTVTRDDSHIGGYAVKFDGHFREEWYGTAAVHIYDPTEDMARREHIKAQSWVNPHELGIGGWLTVKPESVPAHRGANAPLGSAEFLRACQEWAAKAAASAKPIDPMDVEYDGIRLGVLLKHDERRREETPGWVGDGAPRFTPAQRAAVSAHWSALLRAKVQAGAKTDAERE